MKVLAIVGTQLRHQYFLANILDYFDIVGIIEFKRTLVQPPKFDSSIFSKEDLDIEKIHLDKLAQKEQEYFLKKVSSMDKTHLNIKSVLNSKELNTTEIIEWVKGLECDVAIDYGSGILSDEFLDALPKWKINLHGGLSPFFKGSATLLWPFYMQQPELAGMTFHLLSKNIDGGDIIHHSRMRMNESDSVADIGCKAVMQSTKDAISILNKLKSTGDLKLFKQKGGKLFLEKDYKPSCIKIVNWLFENGLIKNYLLHKDSIDAKYIFYDQFKEA